MTKILWLLLVLLPGCSKAEDPCSDLAQTAIGAALDDPTETYNLAVDFYTGKCVEKNYKNAANLWEKAAKHGVVSAKNNLGYLLSEGLGVKQDQPRAAALWLEAAIAGHAESQVHIGNALFYGIGVPKDQTRGLAWILSAATTAVSQSEPGGGPEVLKMAQEERAKMLGIAPQVLGPAETLVGQLGIQR